ncbi:MAG: flagellin [Alphaproteobacteria bacterium]|nr:flagellin [Alphaproteobacteria bacterium]
MLNRIGDFAQSQRITAELLQTQTRTRIAQAQISSGKVSDRFQDIAADVERLIDVKLMIQQNQQFQDNITFTDKNLIAMESAVSGLFDVATRAQNLAIQRINDPNTTPGLIAPEFENLLDQAVAYLNDDIGGRYMFGGSQTARKPVELDPAFTAFGTADATYYQGDDLVLSTRVDIGVEITTTMSADLEGFQEVIGGLRGLINGDLLDDDVVLENSLGLIHDSLGKIADYQAELGIRQTQLDRVDQGHIDAEIYLENRVSEIEDVDITEAITRLAQDQIILESAMATVARMRQLNLVDYL